MPADKVAHYNRIDIGIFLLFLEVCLEYNGITFKRELMTDDLDDTGEQVLVAEYDLE